MPEMASDLSAEVIAGIKREQSSGKIRMVAGRPWWVSSFSLDELKGAGLI